MHAAVERHRPDLLERALAELGKDPFARVEEGTAWAQPALYCASLAGWSQLGEPTADLYAGHSLGEVAALVAAGSIGAEDGLRLVVLRGRLMQRAADFNPGGGMLAVRTGATEASAIAAEAGLSVANDNAPDQVVLSGTAEEILAGMEAARRAGLRAKRLAVSGAFHSPAMAAAVPQLEKLLAEMEFRPARAPVFSCVTAAPFDDVRRRLAEALVRPVRWREILLALHSRGVRRFVEVGPGRVLTGLVRKTLDGVEAEAPGTSEAAHG